ncbi:MAG: hypothetical protein IPK13_07895 [Deltaproteobacteria bacterium]|nr:hypothetical protein [Deltaproteobacteria bacterium]
MKRAHGALCARKRFRNTNRVFASEEEGPRFVECPAPTNRDLLSLAQSVFKKMEKFLAKSGQGGIVLSPVLQLALDL